MKASGMSVLLRPISPAARGARRAYRESRHNAEQLAPYSHTRRTIAGGGTQFSARSAPGIWTGQPSPAAPRPLTRAALFQRNAGAAGAGLRFMEFIDSHPDIVRSINQCWLLHYWTRLRGRAALPMWNTVEAEEIAALLDNLSFQDVVGTDGAERFLILFHGTRIAETFGSNCHGKYLDEILPESYRPAALATYHQVLATRLPVYTIADMRDRAGRIVHYERLLLPFSDDGINTARILASLETVSPQGTFARRDLMKEPPRPPAFALCTTIRI
jgi:hypothetical protein